ncbi:hypothetical protein L195_g048955 [Trifolium pratense]|uniref:Uncharacterized protein n=1 Tax=Trifolium pratense TaxID=57577 RepID=A0A2K3JMU4_TRIPR|nr:hypothetical protein L195_g048955 [Trifolium pratense]
MKAYLSLVESFPELVEENCLDRGESECGERDLFKVDVILGESTFPENSLSRFFICEFPIAASTKGFLNDCEKGYQLLT